MNKSAKKMIGYASAKIMNIPIDFRLVGDQTKIHIVETAIQASQYLFESLRDPKSSMANIQNKLLQKRNAARDFKQHFGFTWPL
ncbi:MAG: hypothetical protein CMB80_09365 [Flammeovirgaceae bacterium]|nr:hypothetical protein [Flammeovirgaceae bacterium]|tara:strand:- start:925 stop:1176 length:252 start_codon:yes stop_codon:yes gene_type:complete